MKRNFIILFLAFIMFLSTCSSDNSEIIISENNSTDISIKKIEHSTKGWELYSWKMDKYWNYSILIGSNHLKTYEEVTSSKILVTGEEKLKEVLKMFPKDEVITWIGEGWLKRCWQSNYYNLELPPEIIISDIRQYCNEIKLILYVTD